VKDLRRALNDIIKLHQVRGIPGPDEELITVCSLCTGEGEFRNPQEWPCSTVVIAHKALNPQISLKDLRKDGLQRARLEAKQRENAEWVEGSKPNLEVVS
jgi:hypothetical protein